MKIIIKILQGEKFNLEVQPNDPMKDIKTKILDKIVQNNIGSSQLILSCNGKYLEDEFKTIGAYGINEGNAIIVKIIENANKDNQQNKEKHQNHPQQEIKEEKKNDIVEEKKQNIQSKSGSQPQPNELKKNSSIIKILTSEDPINMEKILYNIKEIYPTLLQSIKNNREMFQNYLKEPIDKNDLEIFRNNYTYAKTLLLGRKQLNQEKIEILLNKKEYDYIQKKVKDERYKIEDVVDAYIKNNKSIKFTNEYLKKSK